MTLTNMECVSDNMLGYMLGSLHRRSHLIQQQRYETGTIIPIFPKRKLGLKKVESFTLGLAAYK